MKMNELSMIYEVEWDQDFYLKKISDVSTNNCLEVVLVKKFPLTT